MSEEQTKECASAITPLLNGRKGTTIYCCAPRLTGTLFCARHQRPMDRIYIGTVCLTEYDYRRTDLDRFN